jgi:predicted N-acetyltransferase YhbS
VDAIRDDGYVQLSLVAKTAGQFVGDIHFSDLPIITEAVVPVLRPGLDRFEMVLAFRSK